MMFSHPMHAYLNRESSKSGGQKTEERGAEKEKEKGEDDVPKGEEEEEEEEDGRQDNALRFLTFWVRSSTCLSFPPFIPSTFNRRKHAPCIFFTP